MLEILAPAGNIECAKAAINAGADAVYLGFSNFSARQSAENFDAESLRAIVEYAHLCNVKIYVAMNTLVKDDELSVFFETLKYVWETGIDAIILQDVFLGKYIHETYPEIVLHVSTQAGICNENGAIFAKECGFSRVILARETPLAEIAKITPIIETEVFVQGALCTAYSGQCYFSSFIGGNSGNRGRCKQPCRKMYTYNRLGNTEKTYALSLSDLSVGEDIQKLIDVGVTSFKIEGRMRRAEYVSAAVSYYRSILDNAKNVNVALSNLKRTYNRGNYTKGLAFGQDKRFLSTAVQGHIGEKIGTVKVINGQFFVESAFRPRMGDAFKLLRDGKEIGGASFLKTDKRGFFLQTKFRLKNGDGVFITTDTQVNESLLSKQRRVSLPIELYFREGKHALMVSGDIQMQSTEVLQSASSRPLSEEELKSCFLKTDGLPVDILFTTVLIEGNIFIPKSVLNAMRRAFYDKIRQAATKKACITLPTKTQNKNPLCGKNTKTAVIACDFTGIDVDVAIYKPNDFSAPFDKSFVDGMFEKYLYYPPFCTASEESEMLKHIAECHIDGVYAENYGALVFAKKYGLKIFVGTGLNVFNQYATSALFQDKEVAYYAISKETTTGQQYGLVSEKAFVFSMGDIKLMDLCYCPFGKTCNVCDKKQTYTLTDENGRVFPVRRYLSANGDCRFEVYNCAKQVGTGIPTAGKLLDLSLTENKRETFAVRNDIEMQKNLFEKYTSGHATRGVL